MRLALAALPLALLAACGGDDPLSGQELADAIGCEGWSDTSEELFVSEGGACEVDVEEVFVYTFSDNDNRDSWLEAAETFGGGPFLVGDSFVLTGTRETLEAVTGVEGEVQP